MNITQNIRRSLGVALGLGAALLAPTAGAVSILASGPGGPVGVNDEFDVSFSVAGWVPSDGEIDGISFRVSWDPSLFTYVFGSVISDDTEFLAEPTQGAGYTISDDTDATFSALGLYLFGVSDSGDATAGSVGGLDGAGTLGSIRLKRIAAGSGTVATSTNNVDEVFADTSLNGIAESGITGGINFGSVIIPEPSTGLLAVLACSVLLAGRRRRIS